MMGHCCKNCRDEAWRRQIADEHDSHPVAVIAFWAIYGTVIGAVAVWWITR